MNLYLVRHAEAVALGGIIRRDFDRPLSTVGEADAEIVGKSLVRLDPNINVVVTSPLVRAVQTGGIIGRAISRNPIFHVSEHLAPGFRQKSLLDELVALSGDGSIAAVGHQPDMSMFVSYLLSGTSHVAFQPGSVAGLKVKASRAESHLLWLLSPEIIRGIGL
ncbi:MAG: phosphohistidine phosphatase SixA [Bacteroidota bacterium]